MFVKNSCHSVFLSFLSMIVSLSFLEAAAQDYSIMEPHFHIQLQRKAQLLHSLHHGEDLLILPNAWDALSATIFEKAGAKAIATTSAGMAAVFGYADGQYFPKELLFIMVDRIVKSVTVPVTVDLEAGFGDTIEEICETVFGLLKIGVAGINIEDADPKQRGHLFSIAEQAEKIRAIKDLASKVNVPLFINARTDVFWLNVLPQEEHLPETLVRLQAYQNAGADGVFVPGLTNLDLIAEIVKIVRVPLNLLAGNWVKDLTALKLMGVSRVTMGSSATRECAGNLQILARHYLGGNYTLNPSISYTEFNALFDHDRK